MVFYGVFISEAETFRVFFNTLKILRIELLISCAMINLNGDEDWIGS
jgi:hypothetical protein